MARVDPLDSELLLVLETRFVAALRRTLRDVLNADEALANEYQALLPSASSFERLLALHEEPLTVAAELSDTVVTDTHIEKYNGLGLDGQTGLPAGPAEIPIPKNLFSGNTVFVPTFTVPPLHTESRPAASSAISLTTLNAMLRLLGYHLESISEPGLYWTLGEDKYSGRDSFLPEHILTPTATFYSRFGEAFYDRQATRLILANLFVQARPRGYELSLIEREQLDRLTEILQKLA